MDTILIIEADHTLRALLRDWLAAIFDSYEILEAEDEDAAVSAATARSPGAIVADVDRREKAGLEMIRRVKAAAPSAEIVALAMDNHRPFREAAKAAGASASVSKCLMGDELLPTLSRLIRREQRERRRQAPV